jgi:hypothetical protein
MKRYVCLVLLALAACREEPTPGVCCLTNADCARLGGIQPRGCPDGFACRDLLCQAADCAASADCPADQPVCDPGPASCARCAASADCAGRADAPVCDPATGGCRGCALDAECSSEVCDVDTGRCVAESDVIYASPGGAGTAGCTHAQPCSVARAIVVASADPSSSLVRLLPGTYTTPLSFTSGTVKLVGTGATLMANLYPYQVEARESAVVDIRGFEIFGNIRSSNATSLFPSLTLRDTTIRSGMAFAVHGILRMVRSSIGQSPHNLVSVQNDGIFEADRTRFSNSSTVGSSSAVNALGRRMRVRITNSIFERALLVMSSHDDAPDRSEFHVLFSTFVIEGNGQVCNNPYNYPRIALFENNIFVTSGLPSVIVGNPSACTFAGNIIHPQDPDIGGTNIDQDPRFVDLQGKDYRLQPGSPAIDAAVPSSGPGLDHDFAGTPRPQGARRDIGAFEWAP